MKDLTQFIGEALNEAKTIPGIGRNSFEDIAYEIEKEGDDNNEDWYKVLKDIYVYDALEYWAAFGDLAKKLKVDEDELRDWVEENDEALKKYLLG